MKPADKRLFESLSGQVSNLHMYWKIYRQLYAKSRRRIDLLNETGSLVFQILHGLLLDEVTLAFCRLTDPPKSAGKSTHSLARLVDRVDDQKHPLLKRKLSTLLDDLKIKTKVFRHRRNKAIAHSDLAVKLRFSKDPLPGISRATVEAALLVLREFMNTYQQELTQGITAYEMVILPLGSDGDFLADQLKRAVALRDLERKGDADSGIWKQGRYGGA